jgi:leader peptidase (prepilin peptidase)/N-methyltransferase
VHCGHKLASKDLLPVFSWLSLGGRCRYCKKKISPQYPLIETLTAALFVLSYLYWPFELTSALSWLQLGLWLAALVILIALLVYDLRWMLLPNRLVFPLIGVAGLYVLSFVVAESSISPLFTGLLGVLFSAGLFWLMFQLSDGKWIGGGDVKMAIALGLLVGGPINAVLLIFIASLLGSLVSVPAMVKGKVQRTSKIPFGPFLIVATYVVVLFGEKITSWYQQTFLGL